MFPNHKIVQNSSDSVDYFELFFSRDLIQDIIQETNRYAQQYQNLKGNLF
jgi:hypothetical protein